MMKFSFFVSLAKWVLKITMWVVFVAWILKFDWANWLRLGACHILVARKGSAYSFRSLYMQIKITELWLIIILFSNLYSFVSFLFSAYVVRYGIMRKFQNHHSREI